MHGTLPIAKTYKTPAELGFTQEEFNALAWFVEQYDAGNIPDVDIDSVPKAAWEIVFSKTPPNAFYMPYVKVQHSCGTAGCIFGYVAHRVPHVRIGDWPKPIVGLMHPCDPNIKARDARDATVRVLQGKPAW